MKYVLSFCALTVTVNLNVRGEVSVRVRLTMTHVTDCVSKIFVTRVGGDEKTEVKKLWIRFAQCSLNLTVRVAITCAQGVGTPQMHRYYHGIQKLTLNRVVSVLVQMFQPEVANKQGSVTGSGQKLSLRQNNLARTCPRLVEESYCGFRSCCGFKSHRVFLLKHRFERSGKDITLSSSQLKSQDIVITCSSIHCWDSKTSAL